MFPSFNSRTPCGVRPGRNLADAYMRAFQFTHPVWGATWGSRIVQITIIVSINAPRVGCDSRYIAKSLIFRTFQFTHPVWGATPARVVVVLYSLFQFTHPVWGATDHVLGELGSRKFQFTHPVWGATIHSV